ncbi:MAG: hypothetical protein AAF915_07615 [Cyanobacteria bacterium P01_D01_bin.50]
MKNDFLTCKYRLKNMLQNDLGHIVTIDSLGAVQSVGEFMASRLLRSWCCCFN